MFGKTWSTSERKYEVIMERGIRVKMKDGVELYADIFRPKDEGKFPAILGYHPYDADGQWAPIMPRAFASVSMSQVDQEKGNGPLEAGDPNFYARRGYAHIIANIRGTGPSDGYYPFLAAPEAEDGCELIEWIARQPWCDGNVGMFGVSYFGRIQQFIASLRPPSLKCIFAPWASTDQYRDALYHGGILAQNWAVAWPGAMSNIRYCSESRRDWSEQQWTQAIDDALADKDISSNAAMVAALKNPEQGLNPLVVDIVLNRHDGPFWAKRKVNYDSIEVPAYIGADWGIYGLHLPGAFRSWEQMRGPKKMTLAPPAYLERPVYQLQYESLRWFDYWLKRIETGIMQEPPIRAFVMGTHQWKHAEEWPLPQTKWTPFNLHEGGLLWEHEHFAHGGSSSFSDSPYGRGSVAFVTPELVEDTEVIGPAVLNLYASTSDTEVLWFVSLREVDRDGKERILTRGWLRGSHREVCPKRSTPWRPYHPHTKSEPLTPGEIYEFKIEILPTANLFKAGSRIKLKIACCDDQPSNSLESIAGGHIRRQSGSRVTVFHNEDHPSHLVLPITAGNVIGTYISGGKPYL
jgi:predicted acyl esterase